MKDNHFNPKKIRETDCAHPMKAKRSDEDLYKMLMKISLNEIKKKSCSRDSLDSKPTASCSSLSTLDSCDPDRSLKKSGSSSLMLETIEPIDTITRKSNERTPLEKSTDDLFPKALSNDELCRKLISNFSGFKPDSKGFSGSPKSKSLSSLRTILIGEDEPVASTNRISSPYEGVEI